LLDDFFEIDKSQEYSRGAPEAAALERLPVGLELHHPHSLRGPGPVALHKAHSQRALRFVLSSEKKYQYVSEKSKIAVSVGVT